MNKFEIVILGAGKGSRMKTKTPKLLNTIHDKTILEWTIAKAKLLKSKKINILINKDYKIFKYKHKKMNFIIQNRQLGTGHALKIFYQKYKNLKNNILVMMGDAPFINKNHITRVVNKMKYYPIVVLGAKIKNNRSHGVLKLENNYVKEIKEFNLSNNKEKKIQICNTGVFGIKKNFLKLVKNLKKNKIKKEYLLTDIVNIAYKKKIKVKLVLTNGSKNSFGINTIKELNGIKRVLKL